jgi:hypothetical protein
MRFNNQLNARGIPGDVCRSGHLFVPTGSFSPQTFGAGKGPGGNWRTE